jgi:predicted transport protein
MPLFNVKNNNLIRIKELVFKLEKDIQTITESNLENIFNLKFVKSEFALNNLRIDTLAFDEQTKSFVIIEYKRDKNFSVIDQGYAYLSLMLNNKADFILEFNENNDNKSLRKDDVDWSQSRIIFISPSFSKYQKQAINFKDLPIELWQITKYDNQTIQYLQLKSPDSSESINVVGDKNKVVKEVSKEVKVYAEEDHLINVTDDVVSLYKEIKEKISEIDDSIAFNPQRYYISLRKDKNFSYIKFTKSKIDIVILVPYEEGKNKLRHHKVTQLSEGVQKFYGRACFTVHITDSDNLGEVIDLIIETSKKIN